MNVVVFAAAWISFVFGAKLEQAQLVKYEGKPKKCADVGEEALADDKVDEPCGNGGIADDPNKCDKKWVRYRGQGIICGSINGNCGTVGLCDAPPEPKLPESFADCKDAKAKNAELGQEAASGMYAFTDGSHHWCDMKTDGGGWTMLMRVNKDFDWIPRYKHNTFANGTKVDFAYANIWHKSHWGGPSLEPGREMDSGISTNPKLIAAYKGSGDWELRFSFYDAEDATEPVNDGVVTLSKEKGQRIFHPVPQDVNFGYHHHNKCANCNGVHYMLHKSDYSFKKLKTTGQSWRGMSLCWTCHRHHYEGGLHFGSGHHCHLDNNGGEIMLKSHLGRCDNNCKATSWYGGHHGFLEHGALQVKHKKIAVSLLGASLVLCSNPFLL